MLAVKKARTEDIPVIQSITEITWPATYGAILPPEQIQYMLQLFYSTASLKEQLLHKGHRFIIAFDNADAVGFAAYSPKSVTGTTWRLHKLYIDPGQQGKGIGRLLLDHISADIIPQGATALELNVNRQNKAIDFYKHYGFTIIKTEDIDIGNGYFMNDYVMEKEMQTTDHG